MSSRKEQKEALRREREQREAQAKAAQRRRQLIGYGAGGIFAAAIVAVLVVLAINAGGNSDGEGGTRAGGSSDVLPSGGEVPEPETDDLQQSVEAAGCELSQNRASSVGEHTTDLSEQIEYAQNPPNSGKHFQVAAEDGAYEQAPDVKELVHSLEHGRIVIWFKSGLPEEQRANLKALYDEDTYQMLIAPNETDMPFEVAVTAWGAEPRPGGTGYTLGCPKYDEGVFDAIRAFKDEHRSKGPEPVP